MRYCVQLACSLRSSTRLPSTVRQVSNGEGLMTERFAAVTS